MGSEEKRATPKDNTSSVSDVLQRDRPPERSGSARQLHKAPFRTINAHLSRRRPDRKGQPFSPSFILASGFSGEARGETRRPLPRARLRGYGESRVGRCHARAFERPPGPPATL